MTAAIALQYLDTTCARILCVGDDVRELIRIPRQLDSELDFVIVASPSEASAALAHEAPFDLIISDQRMRGVGGASFLARMRTHSPDAERLILVRREDRGAKAMAASDGRVMRLLVAPCAQTVLREAVSDALLRHRARCLRVAAVPRVTPMGAHPCCATPRSNAALTLAAR